MAKKGLSKGEIERMSKISSDDPFDPSKVQRSGYRGSDDPQKNLSDLQDKLMDIESKRPDYGVIEYLYSIATKIIPRIKGFNKEVDTQEKDKKIVFHHEVPIDVKGLDDEYAINMEFALEYEFEGDEDLDKPEGSIWVFFSPNITTERESVDMSKTGSDVEKIQRLLYGTPDKEDEYFKKKYAVSEQVTTFDELKSAMGGVKENINAFSGYVKDKYDIDLFS